MLEDPYAVAQENRREGRHSLVRPYVAASGYDTNGLPDAMAGSSEFDFREDEFIGPQASAADLEEVLASPGPGDRADKYATRLLADCPAVPRPRRPGKAPGSAGPAARGRTLAAVVMVGAAAVAGTTFLVLTSHSKVTSMAGCGPGSCPVATATASISVTPGRSSAGGARGAMYMSASQAATPQASSPPPAVNPTPTLAASVPSTTPPASGSPTLAVGSVISFEATSSCCQSFSITHDKDDNGVVIADVTPDSSATTQADAVWLVRKGLADSSCVSFESANADGDYLRQRNSEVYLDSDDGSAQFADDATFCPRPGNTGQGYSFASYDDPQLFIRHFDNIVYIASDGGPNSWDTAKSWHHDTTWNVIQYLS